jgi:3-phenylpropionate/cinnamic acid dioxygenase small subunit
MTSTQMPPDTGAIGSSPIDVVATAEVAAFLFHEGQLIDDLELEAWLDLFEPDATYTLPMGPKDAGTHLRVALVCDDRARLEERVMRVVSGSSYSQSPPSRTVHQIGNVSILRREGDEVDVRSNQIIVELRHGLQRVFAAECRHRLRRTEHGHRIISKTIYLLDRNEPMGDLTFVL